MTEPSLADRPASVDVVRAAPADDRGEGLWADAWRELRRRPLFWIASVIILVLVVMAFFPSLFTAVDPRAGDLARSGNPPSPDAVFGYDLQGRDVYARAVYGAAPTLAVGVLATIGAILVGGFLGLVVGYSGGVLDSLVSRIGEIFAGIPFVLGGIVILSAINRPGQVVEESRLVIQVVLTIVVLTWPLAMRIMRAAALSSREQDYVRAARALGAGPWRVMLRHMLPNSLAPVLVYATIQLGVFVGLEGTLSFIGIGLRDPAVSWGVMISESQERIAQIPHAILFPAAFLVVTVLAFVMLGDAVRDALDPEGALMTDLAKPRTPLLEVSDLHVEFGTGAQKASVLNGVSYHVDEGETLAVLGESGSGKSVTAQTVMGILDTPPGRITAGAVRFRGEELLAADEERRRLLRGESMAMVFQDALSALNPVYTVGFQIAEQFRFRRGMSRKDAMARAAEMLDQVRIPNAKQRVKEYPHQFSGGMRQRAMIAMSLALDPELLIADEPTTALDVTVQAQIMELLDELRRERGMGLVLITHDLGVVAEVADRIAVMYAGRIVEQADAVELYARPAHPYTRGLMASVPSLEGRGGRLEPIPGLPPSLAAIPPGCPFHPRCAHAEDRCTTEVPLLRDVSGVPPLTLGVSDRTPTTEAHRAACHFAERFVADDARGAGEKEVSRS